MADTPDALLLTVGAQLSAAMTRNNLSQLALSHRANAGPATVSKALRCGDIRISTLLRLADAAGCNVVITLAPR